jgi:hypothetical protein
MMEAVCTSETSVYYETMWRYIPEGSARNSVNVDVGLLGCNALWTVGTYQFFRRTYGLHFQL